MRVVGTDQSVRATVQDAYMPTKILSPDRVANVRMEALEQSWGELILGEMEMKPGKYQLVLQAGSIPGPEIGEIKGVWIEKR